jgi:hypothetical protein
MSQIWHLPLPELLEGDQMRAHLDMAEISIVAEQTGVTAMGNFRVSEMCLGRQGVSYTLDNDLLM